MKFHKEIKIPKLDRTDIRIKLDDFGFQFRTMRSESILEDKLETTNTYTKYQFIISEESVEVRCNGDYNAFSMMSTIAKIFDLKIFESRWLRSDIGYPTTWEKRDLETGQKVA
tara:strand:- start:568 stop:906 length:339 start_codon:yes stop_codon:yes gene_type:complete